MGKANWLIDEEFTVLTYMASNGVDSCSFDLTKITEAAADYGFFYGVKQDLSDAKAGMADKDGYTEADRISAMQGHFLRFSNAAYKVVRSEKGFSFKDPDAVSTPKQVGVTLSVLEEKIKTGTAEQRELLVDMGIVTQERMDIILAKFNITT